MKRFFWKVLLILEKKTVLQQLIAYQSILCFFSFLLPRLFKVDRYNYTLQELSNKTSQNLENLYFSSSIYQPSY